MAEENPQRPRIWRGDSFPFEDTFTEVLKIFAEASRVPCTYRKVIRSREDTMDIAVGPNYFPTKVYNRPPHPEIKQS
jgi:hypothetical protein